MTKTAKKKETVMLLPPTFLTRAQEENFVPDSDLVLALGSSSPWQSPTKESDANALGIQERNDPPPGTPLKQSHFLQPGLPLYPLCCPPEAMNVKWFKDAFEFLNVDLGTPFITLVSRWSEYEGLNGWETSRTALSNVNRPVEITKWIRYGRYNKIKISIAPSEIDNFAARMWAWWAYLQPEWREFGEDKRPLPVERFGDDWASIDIHGNNGWLSLLAGLRWWGECLAQRPRQNRADHDWLGLIEDMSKILVGLIAYKRKTM
ncbi:hypothetical protein F5880DRAFT_1618598 [Lentinula raphanica]|nr:hypothetical protein F5880DRAFT_1618598 [Lentinula raphanica]